MTPIRQLALTATAALGFLAPALAADPPAADAPEDAQLSRSAYSALQRTEGLSDFNIGVRVLRGGKAVLWGTAPRAEVARAEAILKSMPGITSVVNTCEGDAAADPLVARVGAAVKTPDPAKPDPKPEVVKADPPKPEAAPPALGPSPLAAGAAVSRHTTTVEKPRTALSPTLEPATRLLEPVAASPPVDYAAVERVRRGDPRFARLTLDQRDGRVVISGSAADPAAAWDLARKIAPHVGDRDVVVGKLQK